MGRKDVDEGTRIHSTKRCWNCNTHLDLKIDRCTYCKAKVLEVNEHGVAKKPFDWKGYIMTLVATTALVSFMWWAFFRK